MLARFFILIFDYYIFFIVRHARGDSFLLLKSGFTSLRPCTTDPGVKKKN